MLLADYAEEYPNDTEVFQWAPTLGGECYGNAFPSPSRPAPSGFNGHPPLGVNATKWEGPAGRGPGVSKFQWAPTLGGECYSLRERQLRAQIRQFQWAPTLGGECYSLRERQLRAQIRQFQWAPTLGGECYAMMQIWSARGVPYACFNGHPPLGVNATGDVNAANALYRLALFQWAPTLGGECYSRWFTP